MCTIGDSFECANCKISFPPGSESHGCHLTSCNYHVCEDCFEVQMQDYLVRLEKFNVDLAKEVEAADRESDLNRETPSSFQLGVDALVDVPGGSSFSVVPPATNKSSASAESVWITLFQMLAPGRPDDFYRRCATVLVEACMFGPRDLTSIEKDDFKTAVSAKQSSIGQRAFLSRFFDLVKTDLARSMPLPSKTQEQTTGICEKNIERKSRKRKYTDL